MIAAQITTVYAPASFGKPNHAVLFHNESGFKFTDVTASSGLADLPPTYQAAWADFKHGVLTKQVEGGTGEGNQNDLVLHFGLGAAKTPVDIEITWPRGKTQRIRHVRPDRMIDVKYGQRH